MDSCQVAHGYYEPCEKSLRTIIKLKISERKYLLTCSFHYFIDINCFALLFFRNERVWVKRRFSVTLALIPFLTLLIAQKCSSTKFPGSFELLLKRTEIWCCATDFSAKFFLGRTNGLQKAIFIRDSSNLLSEVAGEYMKKRRYLSARIIGRWFG